MIKKDLGKIKFNKKILIADPCYHKDSNGTKVLVVKSGNWLIQSNQREIKNWGVRCCSLIALYEGFLPLDHFWIQEDGYVGVDSGQLGIFNYSSFGKKLKEEEELLGEIHEERRHLKYMIKNSPILNQEKEASSLIKKLLGSDNDELDNLGKMLLEMENRQKEIKKKLKRNENKIPRKSKDFYEICCDKTMQDDRAGIFKGGVVSASGFGDGGYKVFTIEKRGEIVGIKIVFIEDHEK